MASRPDGDVWNIVDNDKDSQHYGRNFKFDFSYISSEERISVLQVCVMVIVQNLLQMEISVRDFLKGRNAILAVVISQHQSI